MGYTFHDSPAPMWLAGRRFMPTWVDSEIADEAEASPTLRELISPYLINQGSIS
jgi:hypothetical protein